jgi:hypothetical protein
MTRTLIAVAVLGAALAGGCASAPQPSADLTQAHTLVDQAEQGGAAELASADLASARSKLQAADQDARDKPELSIRLAQEASVDARVALARTNAAKAQTALRDETDRTQSAQSDSSVPVPSTPAMPQ